MTAAPTDASTGDAAGTETGPGGTAGSAATSPAGYLRLTRAVVEKRLILLRRYWINTAMMLVAMYLFFAMFFYSGRAVGGSGIGDTLDAMIVGFFLLTAASSAYFDVSGNIMREAQWGTLEQLFMSPYGIGRVLAINSAFNVVFSTTTGLVILGVALATTDRTLAVDAVTVVPLLVVTILSAIGLGFVFAGLSLLYKRIENVSRLMQFAFIALIAAPASTESPVLALVPLSYGSGMLTRAMTDGVRLWEFEPVELAILAGNGAAYLLIGYAVFHLFVRRARDLGVMGHY